MRLLAPAFSAMRSTRAPPIPWAENSCLAASRMRSRMPSGSRCHLKTRFRLAKIGRSVVGDGGGVTRVWRFEKSRAAAAGGQRRSRAVQNNQISPRALVPQADNLLVVGRLVPGLRSLSRRKLDNHGAGVLPLPFKHGQLAAARDKLSAKCLERGNDLFAVFRKHGFIVDRLCRDQVGTHLTLPS